MNSTRASSLFGWVALGFVAMHPAPAHADALGAPDRPLSAQEEREVAAVSHRAGVEQYARGHYRDAIALFLEANRLAPSAALSFNVARCYEQLDDAENALAWYRDYLRRAGKIGDRAQIQRHIDRYEKRLANKGVQQVSVFTQPPGAALAIDGAPVGSSPWTGTLAPGAHALAVNLAGYDDKSEHFSLEREHARDIELTLHQKPAPLPVASPAPVEFAGKEPARAVRELPETAAPASSGAERTAPTPAVVASHGSGGSGWATAGWVGVGAGGAALGAALVFEILRHGAESDAAREPRQIEFARDVSDMRSYRTAARVLAGTGGVLALAGGAVLLFDAARDERADATHVSLSCAPWRCTASLKGRM